METPGQNEPEPAAKRSGNGSGSRTAPESHSSQFTHKATGPRTVAGKRRSRYNALKSGLFAKGLLLKNESRAEYDSLLAGLRKDFRPQGKLEMVLVENLAVIHWRKQRLFQAERAQIDEAVELKTFDSSSAQAIEAWDRARAGQTPGGILRDSSNSFVVRKAKEILTLFRDNFEKCGFQKDEDAWVLKKIYGLDGDDAAPFNFLQVFLMFSEAAREALRADETSTLPDQLKKAMVELFDTEIERLDGLAKLRLEMEGRRSEYQIIAASILPQGDLERVIRYEAHLSREFDRTFSQLERLQKIRLGQPTPPTVRVDVLRE